MLDAHQTLDAMLTQHLIDAVPHQFTPDPTEMQRIPHVYVAFDE
jgi:hypothetical protein